MLNCSFGPCFFKLCARMPINTRSNSTRNSSSGKSLESSPNGPSISIAICNPGGGSVYSSHEKRSTANRIRRHSLLYTDEEICDTREYGRRQPSIFADKSDRKSNEPHQQGRAQCCNVTEHHRCLLDALHHTHLGGGSAGF
mmetsp:Transcript_5937/g.15697  ORF Transcript_5937/g.15697 Transcript_5937/m.15697 type:complete len:141 (+) Transcript_5937:253-675(+)